MRKRTKLVAMQRKTALKQLKHQQQRSQPPKRQQPSSQPRKNHPRQLVVTVTLAALNASLFLETPRRLKICIACLVVETPCNHGGHARSQHQSASAKLAETFWCKHCILLRAIVHSVGDPKIAEPFLNKKHYLHVHS